MSLPACLVTSTPSFEEPERTRPFLIAPSASPDLRQIKVADHGALNKTIEFSAGVVSEDNGVSVKGRLVLDYGVALEEDEGYPYLDTLAQQVDIPAATLQDPPRTLSAKWSLLSNGASSGCHTVTLFATHEIDFISGCPADAEDFDFLTWTVFACNSNDAPCCDPTLPPDQGGCESFHCPAVEPGATCGAGADPGGVP
jgi:hypothetical protein